MMEIQGVEGNSLAGSGGALSGLVLGQKVLQLGEQE